MSKVTASINQQTRNIELHIGTEHTVHVPLTISQALMLGELLRHLANEEIERIVKEYDDDVICQTEIDGRVWQLHYEEDSDE